jgi:hypothetical protein
MKITKKQLKQIIKEELGDILREVRTRRRGAHYRKYVYPHNKAPMFSVGDDGKPRGRDDRASFRKFYAAVRKNRTARRQLGRRDYHWGQKHSDAYATLASRYGTGPGEVSKVAVSDETAKQIRSVGTEDPNEKKRRVFTDKLAHAISVNAKMARKSEKYKDQAVRALLRVKHIQQDPESGEQEFKEMQKLNKEMGRLADLAKQTFGASISSGKRAQAIAALNKRAKEAFPGFNADDMHQVTQAEEIFNYVDEMKRPGLDDKGKEAYRDRIIQLSNKLKTDIKDSKQEPSKA